MSQSFTPQPRQCESPVPHTAQERIEHGGDIEHVQEAYVQLKDRLTEALDDTRVLLTEIRDFNKDSWVIRYPHIEQSASTSSAGRPTHHRSLSFADDPSSTHNVVVRPGPRRSMTLASVPETAPTADDQQPDSDAQDALLPDFHILRLDLKLGPNGSSTGPSSLVSQLEKTSIANLLEGRIAASLAHMAKLRTRVEDTSSKVLVTGDLNAGKSTFVNALLRREVLPVDQQPCTAMFCEVHDALENDGKEEAHIIKDHTIYKASDPNTYVRAELSELESIVGETENAHRIVKLYVNDARSPTESLVRNGVVDIALIDAPGLNRDTAKTTAIFARQEEIDVVVFVVSAENHFTLSGAEFLKSASSEKAYIFIVVNRFDQIKDKARCKKMVLEQIKEFSPGTYEDAEDLVHFVDSRSVLHSDAENGAFNKLESDLRSFILMKRSKSKLMPATTYLENVLADVSLLSSSNAILAESERDQARSDLALAKPVLEQMQGNRESLEDELEAVEEEGSNAARARTRELLVKALERVGKGEVDQDAASLPLYPGLLGIWEYTREVRKALLMSIDMAVKLSEDEARKITTGGVNKITQMADNYLPKDVERSRRVFMPAAMFSPRAGKKGSKRNSGAIVAGGTYGLGIGLSQRQEMMDVSFLDILDVPHHLSLHLKHSDDDSSLSTSEGLFSLASLGVGALTLAGGKALGARGFVEALVRLGDIFGNERTRKWAAPVLGVVTIGLSVYFVLELPNAIPRNVGRRIKTQLLAGEEDTPEELKFVNSHCVRVGRETRKVLRLASWDLRERFRGAMEERSREVKGKEEMERKAIAALEFFNGVGGKAEKINEEIHQ